MKNITTLSAILGATAFALSMPTAFADTLEQDRLANETVDNSNTIEEVLVSAHPLSGEGLAQAIQTLSGKQLLQKSSAQPWRNTGLSAGYSFSEFWPSSGATYYSWLGRD